MELNGIDSRVDVHRDDVSPAQHAAGHVLPVTRVTLHHLVGRGEIHVCELSDGELSVVAPVRGDEGGVGDDRELVPPNEWKIKDPYTIIPDRLNLRVKTYQK
jgi:hypothetical protein